MTTTMPPLPVGERLPDGLWAGALDRDPRPGRRGRTRRWSYAAAGAEEVAVGAAVVDLGFASTAFAWCLLDGRLLTWEARGLPGISARRRGARRQLGTLPQPRGPGGDRPGR